MKIEKDSEDVHKEAPCWHETQLLTLVGISFTCLFAQYNMLEKL